MHGHKEHECNKVTVRHTHRQTSPPGVQHVIQLHKNKSDAMHKSGEILTSILRLQTTMSKQHELQLRQTRKQHV